MVSSRRKPDRGVSPNRPDWLPDTEASRTASYRITPPEILARYVWQVGDCFACRVKNRFITIIGHRGSEADGVPLAMCGSCILVQEERRRARMIRRGRPYVPGGIGQRERREE